MPGTVRPYTLVDVLQTIYGTATGTSANSATTPTTPISLVGEADEQLTLADTAVGLSAVPPGWVQGEWGSIVWS